MSRSFGSTAADTLPHTVATGLGGGKFENLNGVLAAADGMDPDWTLVVDDDVVANGAEEVTHSRGC